MSIPKGKFVFMERLVKTRKDALFLLKAKNKPFDNTKDLPWVAPSGTRKERRFLRDGLAKAYAEASRYFDNPLFCKTAQGFQNEKRCVIFAKSKKNKPFDNTKDFFIFWILAFL